MIHTSKQLKDKIRNISGGDPNKAQMLLRNFIMERFLERVSLSSYKKNFILKGGMLIASLIGVDTRATMDIDTTVKALPLNETDVVKIVTDIIENPVEDNVLFEIIKVTRIMEDFAYPGIRMVLEARLDRLKQRIKIDISTDDVIMPSAVQYHYRLMFEERSIELLAYTTETLLAEKIQTILARGIATTRMRDFYDIYKMINTDIVIDDHILKMAVKATCVKRQTMFELPQIESTLHMIQEDKELSRLWDLYKAGNFYVGELEWGDVCKAVCSYILKKLP